jgi:hypothetical protein
MGEAKTNSSQCQCISCAICSFQHATTSPGQSDISHRTSAKRGESENISVYIGNFFLPFVNFCIEFLDRSVTCELEHTFSCTAQGIPDGLKYLGVRLLRCCGKVVRVFAYFDPLFSQT